MKEVVEFLTLLHRNNDKAWFDAHKGMYKQALSCFEAFTAQLIEGIAAFDPSVAGLTVRDCTYRIYRDVRFSHDKTPYKTHIGAYISPHGKKAGYAGYYFHVEPVATEGAWSQGSLLTSGLYMPTPEVLRSVREEIVENGAEIVAAIEEARGFTLDETARLRRLPKDFGPEATGLPAGSPYEELLRQKDLYVVQCVSTDFMLDENLLENTLREFRKTVHLNALLNRAVQYAFDECKMKS